MERQGHNTECDFCGKPCDSYAGNPAFWPISMFSKIPGKFCYWHMGCVHNRMLRLEAALVPFATYAEKRDARPLLGMDDSIHSIHFGSPHFAELTMEHCRTARKILETKD